MLMLVWRHWTRLSYHPDARVRESSLRLLCMFCRQTLDVAQVSPVLANLNQRPSVAYMPGVNHSTMAVRTTRTKYHHHNDALDTTPTRNNATLSTIVRIRIILAQIPIFSTKTKPYVCINGHQYFFVSTWRRRR